MECSLRVSGGSEVLKNGYKQECSLWSRKKFLGTNSKEFSDKAVKLFQAMLDEFIKDYQKANPTQKISEVRFYFYS